MAKNRMKYNKDDDGGIQRFVQGKEGICNVKRTPEGKKAAAMLSRMFLEWKKQKAGTKKKQTARRRKP